LQHEGIKVTKITQAMMTEIVADESAQAKLAYLFFLVMMPGSGLKSAPRERLFT
jgi:hypothetical protein